MTSCDCQSCVYEFKKDDINYFHNGFITRFLVCSQCGNKRCPHCENHIYKCTNSNVLDQIGNLIETISKN